MELPAIDPPSAGTNRIRFNGLPRGLFPWPIPGPAPQRDLSRMPAAPQRFLYTGAGMQRLQGLSCRMA